MSQSYNHQLVVQKVKRGPGRPRKEPGEERRVGALSGYNLFFMKACAAAGKVPNHAGFVGLTAAAWQVCCLLVVRMHVRHARHTLLFAIACWHVLGLDCAGALWAAWQACPFFVVFVLLVAMHARLNPCCCISGAVLAAWQAHCLRIVSDSISHVHRRMLGAHAYQHAGRLDTSQSRRRILCTHHL